MLFLTPSPSPAAYVLKAIAEPFPPLPAQVRREHAGKDLTGTYKICVDLDGVVKLVTPVVSIRGADDFIVDYIRKNFRYHPPKQRLCKTRVFFFEHVLPPRE